MGWVLEIGGHRGYSLGKGTMAGVEGIGLYEAPSPLEMQTLMQGTGWQCPVLCPADERTKAPEPKTCFSSRPSGLLAGGEAPHHQPGKDRFCLLMNPLPELLKIWG